MIMASTKSENEEVPIEEVNLVAKLPIQTTKSGKNRYLNVTKLQLDDEKTYLLCLYELPN